MTKLSQAYDLCIDDVLQLTYLTYKQFSVSMLKYTHRDLDQHLPWWGYEDYFIPLDLLVPKLKQTKVMFPTV